MSAGRAAAASRDDAASSPGGDPGRYEAVIGIEVHCQVRTASKMFCACAVPGPDADPNTHTCPVCLALPGTLPTINRAAVEHVLRTGLAIAATIPAATRWDRKNYFYPDLPKGYQISQYDLPLAADGSLTIPTSAGPFRVRIRRAHLEEDTAKLVHGTAPGGGERVSLVDFNRAGVPLMEIVTEPDLRTAEQARRYAEELRLLVRAIGASDAEMENGQLRVEANISLRRRGAETLGTRVEVKNMNSLRSVERAIEFEIQRQAAALDADEPLRQETRGWDDGAGRTYVMRVKESSDDYRYFPEPDLPPLQLEPARLDALRAALPELPAARRARYEAAGLSPYDAAVLTADEAMTLAFEAIRGAGPDLPPREVANLVTGDYGRALKETAIRTPAGLAGRSDAASLAHVLGEVVAGRLTRANAREVLAEHVVGGAPAPEIVAARSFARISDADAVGRLVDEVLAANPAAVADWRAGKTQAVGFLVGQAMKASRGQASAALVQTALRARLTMEDPA